MIILKYLTSLTRPRPRRLHPQRFIKDTNTRALFSLVLPQPVDAPADVDVRSPVTSTSYWDCASPLNFGLTLTFLTSKFREFWKIINPWTWNLVIKESTSTTMGKTKPGFYAVARGRVPGIFGTWDECQTQVSGFPNARFKKFDTKVGAENFIKENSSSVFQVESTMIPKNKGKNSLYISQPSSTVSDPTRKKPGSKFKPSASAKSPKMDVTSKQPPKLSTPPAFSNFPSSSTTKLKNGSALALSHQLIRPTLTDAASSGGITKSISTSATQFKRQLRVTEDRVIPNKMPRLNLGESPHRFNAGIDPDKYLMDDEGYVVVCTDGACTSNGRRGARAGVGVWFADDHPLNISEPVKGRQTNNTAEIQAAELAIRAAKNCGIDKLAVKTDSQFVINCITKWIGNWKRNGWKLANGSAVKNKEDLEKLQDATEGMLIKWSYVRGHRGHYGNEKADRLAVAGAQKAH